jgi:hypothetical protein
MPPDGVIRYLHAAYAGPDGVTDAELLRRPLRPVRRMAVRT